MSKDIFSRQEAIIINTYLKRNLMDQLAKPTFMIKDSQNFWKTELYQNNIKEEFVERSCINTNRFQGEFLFKRQRLCTFAAYHMLAEKFGPLAIVGRQLSIRWTFLPHGTRETRSLFKKLNAAWNSESVPYVKERHIWCFKIVALGILSNYIGNISLEYLYLGSI